MILAYFLQYLYRLVYTKFINSLDKIYKIYYICIDYPIQIKSKYG